MTFAGMGNRFLGMPIDTSNTIRLMHEIIASARAKQTTEAFQGLHEASKDLVDLEIVIPAGYITDPAPFPARPGCMDISEPARRVPMVTEYGVHGNTATFDPIPYTAEQAPISLEHVAIVDRPLTDSEFQEATEQLDRVLRLPWYKRTPALILWLWRLP